MISLIPALGFEDLNAYINCYYILKGKYYIRAFFFPRSDSRTQGQRTTNAIVSVADVSRGQARKKRDSLLAGVGSLTWWQAL